MKKFRMLIFSLIIFAITIALYFYKNHLKDIPAYKLPSIKYSSSKYKNIKNISPIPYTSSPTLLILYDDEHNINCSNINLINLNTGEVTGCKGLELNKNFDDRIFFDHSNKDNFSLIGNQGLVICSQGKVNNNEKEEKTIYINNFQIDDLNNITDILFNSSLYYIKKNDHLIYYDNTACLIPQMGFNYSDVKKIYSYYRNPYSLIASSYFDKTVYYTKHEKNGLNLYYFSPEGPQTDFSNKPIVNNFVYAKPIQYGYGICGIYEKDNKFNLFFQQDSKKNIEIDTISKNSDMLGQIPDIDMIRFNNKNTIVYSSFDKNHMGTIFIKTDLTTSPKAIIENKPIVGSIKLFHSNSHYKMLFSTLEDNNIKFKIYDIDTNNLEDITHFFN